MSYKIGDKVKVKGIPGEVVILSFFNYKDTNYIVFETETETRMKSRPVSDIIEGKLFRPARGIHDNKHRGRRGNCENV